MEQHIEPCGLSSEEERRVTEELWRLFRQMVSVRYEVQWLLDGSRAVTAGLYYQHPERVRAQRLVEQTIALTPIAPPAQPARAPHSQTGRHWW